jgi:hypothetical protein
MFVLVIPVPSNSPCSLPKDSNEVNRSSGICNKALLKLPSSIMSYQLSDKELRDLALTVQQDLLTVQGSTVKSMDDSKHKSTIRNAYDGEMDRQSVSSSQSSFADPGSSASDEDAKTHDRREARSMAEAQERAEMEKYQLMILESADKAGKDKRNVERWTPKKVKGRTCDQSGGAVPRDLQKK